MKPISMPARLFDDDIECDCPTCKKVVRADLVPGGQNMIVGVGDELQLVSPYVCRYCGTMLTRTMTYRLYADDVEKSGE